MTLWKTYYHLVWATQNRLPLITESIEAELYGYIQNKTKSIECPIYAIGGMPDHIHLIVSIPPSRAVSGYVMRIKGSSSHHINRTFPTQTFAWQHEYGVFSMGSKQVETAIAYVERQKQHHADQTLFRSLEPESFLVE